MRRADLEAENKKFLDALLELYWLPYELNGVAVQREIDRVVTKALQDVPLA